MELSPESVSSESRSMAAGFAVANENMQYTGRMTSLVAFSFMLASMGGIIFGYNIGISGGVTSMDPFLEKFFPDIYFRTKHDTKISNYCKFHSHLLTLFTSSLYIAGFVASVLASRVTRDYGRKPSILIGGASYLIGASLGGAALNIYMVILSRVLLGIGVAFTNQSVPVYLSEMAPTRYKGTINNGLQLLHVAGILLANLINYGTEKIKGDRGWSWRISLSMASVPAFIITLGGFFLPETPNSLIQRGGDHHKARLLLQRVRGVIEVEEEFGDIIQANVISKNNKEPFRKFLERKHRPHLVMAITIPFFQQVTGINVIGFYAPILFRTIGFTESGALMSAVVIGLVASGTVLVSIAVVEKFGRKLLFIVGGVLMFVSQVIIGGIMAAEVGDDNVVGDRYGYAILVLICVYVVGSQCSWGPLAWLVPNEIFPLEIRSAGQSIIVATNFLVTSIIAQTVLSMLCHFRWAMPFFFGGWLTVMTAFVYFLLPETKNLPAEKMDQLWREHGFWKKIVGEVKENDMFQG